MKMMVSAASRMASAISFGVLRRAALSTRWIIRSRKVSPGFAVISITIRSDKTRVPPVTALRSPPASRITGADSPVMADSSTEAMPSTTVPSPGIRSPASQTTRSPRRSCVAGTGTVRNGCALRSPSVRQLPGNELQVLEDRAERQRGEEGKGADDDHHADQEPGKEPGVRLQRARARRNDLLSNHVAGERENRDDEDEAADPHRDSQGGVVVERVASQAGEGAAIVSGRGGERVKDFAEAVRPRVEWASLALREQHRQRRESEHARRQDQDGK